MFRMEPDIGQSPIQCFDQNRALEKYSFTLGHPAKFLRSIKESRRLGNYVKRIDWGWPWQHQPPYRRYLACSTMSPESRLKSFGNASVCTSVDSCVNLLAHEVNINDTYLDTLLRYTPNLEYLTIDDVDSWGSRSVWLKTAKTRTKLKRVEIRGDANILNILALILIPSLRIIQIRDLRTIRDSGIESDAEVRDCLLKDAHVQQLMFEDDLHLMASLQSKGSSIDELSVQDLHLAACPDFKWLLQHMNCLKVVDLVIRRHATTLLKEVFLICPHVESVRYRSKLDEKNTEDTRCFSIAPNLRSLDIPYEVGVYGHESPTMEHLTEFLGCLPMNLTYLAFDTWLFHEAVDVFLDIAPTLRTLLPSLKTLVMVYHVEEVDEYPLLCQRKIARLQVACADAGITFQSLGEYFYFQDFAAIEYIEPGWIWVEPVDLRSYDWKDVDHPSNHTDHEMNYFDDWTVIDCVGPRPRNRRW